MALETIEVTAEAVLTMDGTPLGGFIVFTPSVPAIYDVAGSAVLEGSAVMTVTVGTGEVITIPCTDSVSPSFTYTITQRLSTPDGAGLGPAAVAGVAIPHALGSSVDISALL